MNTPKSDRNVGEKPTDEKPQARVETPEKEMYADTGTPPRDETYRAREERYARGETRPGDERYVDTEHPYRSDADRALGEAGHTVKTGIAGGLRGIDAVESDVVSLVRNTLTNTLRATGTVGTEAVTSARDILLSVVGGVKDVASAVLPVHSRTEDRIPPRERVRPSEYTPPPGSTPPPEYTSSSDRIPAG